MSSRLPLSLRLAWRDVSTHWKRSLIGVLLLALPVCATGFFTQLDSDPRFIAATQQSDYEANVADRLCTPNDDSACTKDPAQLQRTDLERLADAAPGTSFSPTLHAQARIYASRADVHNPEAAVDSYVVAADSPTTASGDAASAGTFPLSNKDMQVLGKKEGDTVAIVFQPGDEPIELTVRAAGASSPGSSEFSDIALSIQDVPGFPPPNTIRSADLPEGWSVTWHADSLAEGLTGADDVGIRAPQVHGDSASFLTTGDRKPLVLEWASGMNTTSDVIAVATVTLLGLVMIAAITGPVFAVAARRNLRNHGLLVANGATARHIRRITLWQGTIIGALGSILGLLGSYAACAIATMTSPKLVLHPRVDMVLALVAAAMCCGYVSALVPAILAARMDPIQALAGGASIRMHRLRGVFLLPPTVAVLLIAVAPMSDDWWPLLLVGIVCCTVLSAPLALFAWTWLAGKVSVPLRLASRDALRNLSRTAPAVGAIAGCLFVMFGMISLSEAPKTEDLSIAEAKVYAPVLSGTALIDQDLADIQRALNAPMRVDSFRAETTVWAARPTPELPAVTEPALINSGLREAMAGTVVIATPAAIDVIAARYPNEISGADSARAKAALESGKAVVNSRAHLRDGKLMLVSVAASYPPAEVATPVGPDGWFVDVRPDEVKQSLPLPAEALTSSPSETPLGAIITPDTARALGLELNYQNTIFAGGKQLTLVDEVRQELTKPVVTVHDDASHDSLGALVLLPIGAGLLLTFAVTLFLVLLAGSESRPDTHTMFAVGASPRLIRRYGAAQGLTVSAAGLLGALIAACVTTITFASVFDDFPASFWLKSWRLLQVQPWGLHLTVVVALLATGWLTGYLFGSRLQRQPAR